MNLLIIEGKGAITNVVTRFCICAYAEIWVE